MTSIGDIVRLSPGTLLSITILRFPIYKAQLTKQLKSHDLSFIFSNKKSKQEYQRVCNSVLEHTYAYYKAQLTKQMKLHDLGFVFLYKNK